MKNQNPYICHFDPDLHTFEYVRQESSFLFSAVLAVSAKILNPAIYPALKNHAESLSTESFRKGWKSPEVVQAMLIMTYWKELDDTRAWLTVGYAIRLAMELGWHKLGIDEDSSKQAQSEIAKRKNRSNERTWLVMFVYDRRSAKPWVLQKGH
jgi:hypothetical protein